MPRLIPQHLEAAARGATPQVVARTLRVRRLPAIALPVVGRMDGGVA